MDEQNRPIIGKAGDFILALLALFMMLVVAVMELWLLIPEATQAGKGTMDSIYLCCGVSSLVLMWLYCLYIEHAHMYERKEAKWHRRRGYLLQVMALVVYAAGQIQDKHPANAIVVAVIVLLSIGVWRSWMHTLALTPEQQKAIDELLEERDRRFKQRITAEQEKASELRFAAIRERYALPEIPKPVTAPAPTEPVVDWRIPRGRHSDVVYFLRNGDRIKIGTTTDLHARVRRLSLRMDDVALVLPGNRAVESQMHQTFRALRVGNTEWFRRAEPLTTFIAAKVTELTKED